MKTILSLFLGLATISAQATELNLHYTCSSPELGVVELELSEPKKETIGCFYYKMNISRYDLNGVLLEERQIETDDLDFYRARICSGGPEIGIRFPPVSADWSQHPDTCWADTPFAGVTFTLDVATGKVLREDENGIRTRTTYRTQELNPRAVRRIVPAPIFYDYVPFVGEKRCKAVPKSHRPEILPNCVRTK